MAGTEIHVAEGALVRISGTGLPIRVFGPYITAECVLRWEHPETGLVSREEPELGGSGHEFRTAWPADDDSSSLRLIIESPEPARLPALTVENPDLPGGEVCVAEWESTDEHGLFSVKTMEFSSGETADAVMTTSPRYGIPWSKLRGAERYRVVIRESDGQRFLHTIADLDVTITDGQPPDAARDIDGPVGEWETHLLSGQSTTQDDVPALLRLDADADSPRLAERLGRTVFDVVPLVWSEELPTDPEGTKALRDAQAAISGASRHVTEALTYTAAWHETTARLRDADLLRATYLDDAFTESWGRETLDGLSRGVLADQNLATTRLFSALLHSLWDRDAAAEELRAAWEIDADYMTALRIDEGTSTYFSHAEVLEHARGDHTAVADSLRFLDDPPRTGAEGGVFVCSCDPVFGQIYLPIWLALADYLEFSDVAFHFVLCGEEAQCAEMHENAQDYLRQLGRLRGFEPESHARNVSFSWVPVPDWVALPRAFYACARMFVAPRLAEVSDSLLIINDIDLAFREDPTPFVRSLPRDRMCLGFSRGAYVLSPWRRIVATTMTVPPGLGDGAMWHDLNSYIEAGLRRSRAWMIDQNAITYMVERAIERGEGHLLQDLADFGRPTRRERVMTLYEIAHREVAAAG